MATNKENEIKKTYVVPESFFLEHHKEGGSSGGGGDEKKLEHIVTLLNDLKQLILTAQNRVQVQTWVKGPRYDVHDDKSKKSKTFK
jgi:hypothetical protein